MPFRASFDCLWCGSPWSVRGPDDLEGFAQLCPACIGRAGENGFLRFRLKTALAERAKAGGAASAVPSTPEPSAASGSSAEPSIASEPPGSSVAPLATDAMSAEMIAYYAARAPEYDDWYRRRGRYSHGPVHDQAWDAELDMATLWLDRLTLGGEVVELAAGTGWWSPLLASKGNLSIYDAAEAPLELARERLVAHGLRAHIHVRDAWQEPDRQVDGLFCGFWLSHVPEARLVEFLRLARRWLRPGGTLAFIDSRPDPSSGAVDGIPITPEERAAGVVRRSLADGREFRVVKVYRESAPLEDALLAAGFATAEVSTTPRFFVLGWATA